MYSSNPPFSISVPNYSRSPAQASFPIPSPFLRSAVSFSAHAAKPDYQQAIAYALKGKALHEQHNDTLHAAEADRLLSAVYIPLKQYEKSIVHAERVLRVARRYGDQTLLFAALNNKGSALLHLNRFAEAQRYLEEAHRAAQSLGDAHYLVICLSNLGNLQMYLRNPDGDMAAFRKMDQQRDSVERRLVNESVLRNTQELEVRHQSRQQAARIVRLNQEKQIQTLSLRQKTLLNYVFLGTIASLLGLGYLFYRNAVSKQIIAGHTHPLQARRIRELEQERQLIAADAIMKGEERERSRLARDLHDGLGGMLSGIKLSLTHMAGNMSLSEANALSFTRTLTQLYHSIQELRRVAHSMMPENLVRFGLCEVLRDYCETMERSARVPIRFQAFGLEERLEQSTEIILYRIVQELLTNVVRHAGATQVLVQVMQAGEHLTLTVEDNGKGFDPRCTGKGIGLGNVFSRVDYLTATPTSSPPRKAALPSTSGYHYKITHYQ